MKLLQSIQHVDTRMFLACIGMKNWQTAAKVARHISRTGDGPLYVIIGALLLLISADQAMLFVSCALLAFLIERPIYWVSKNGLKRNRPADKLLGVNPFIQPSDKFSFPSGHTAAATIMATLISYFYPPLGLIAVPWAVAIGASRVVLGVHFPSDILAGMTLGASCAMLSILWIV